MTAMLEPVGAYRSLCGAVARGKRNTKFRTVKRLAGNLGMDPIKLLAG